ncbi:MAG: hypothetical protein RLZZ15_153 [Verrucomicrobiota bacterium]|jgi:hypothetical protein
MNYIAPLRLLVTAVALFATAFSTAAAEPAWRSLFNGRDLTGWKIVGPQSKAYTAVADGALTGHMLRGTPEHTFFCTEESFGDFILEIDAFQTGGFNTGILFRCVETPATASVRLHGYQVKIDPSTTRRWTGGIFDDYGKNWLWLQTLDGDDRARSAYRFNEWVRFRIEAVGRTLKVWVNGIPTAHLLNDKYTRGPIALKIHSFPATGDAAQEKNLIRYRNVRILTTDLARHAQAMDLPAREADPTQKVLPKP